MRRRYLQRIIDDRPVRVSLYRFEQRLRKYRTLIALMLNEMDDALALMEADRKPESLTAAEHQSNNPRIDKSE